MQEILVQISTSTVKIYFVRQLAMKTFLLLFLLFFSFGCFNDAEQEEFKLAEQEWKEKRYNNSAEKYEAIISKFPEGKYRDLSLLRLGEIYRLNLGNEEKALVYFYRLVKKGKDKYKLIAQENIANIYENDLRDYDQAIIEYQKQIHLSPGPEVADESQFKIAICYFKKGDYFQAITEFEILERDYPSSKLIEEGTFQKLNCYYILGVCEKAIQGYKQFLSDYPSSKYSAEAKYCIGNCLEEKEELKEALKVYKSIKEQNFNQKVLNKKISGLEERLKKRRR